MKIVSVTQTNREDNMVVDALKSVVDLVDECIIVNTTGREKDYTFEKSVVGDKLVTYDYKVIEHSAEVKNFGLLMAKKQNADWALIVDTDERITCKINLRETLEKIDLDYLVCWSCDGQYTKERLIKIPARGMFEGVVHEHFIAPTRDVLLGMTFYELPKSEEAIQKKCDFVISYLEEDLKKFPNNLRSRQYLGSAYVGAKRYDDAIEQFKLLLHVKADREMSAIAHTFLAQCYFEQKKFVEAIETCISGLQSLPTAELFFIAAYASWMLGDVRRAICFGELSITAGEFRGYEFFLNRVGMRATPMLFELPYELLVRAFEHIKDNQAVIHYSQKLKQAKEERIKKYGEDPNDTNKNNESNSG